jgi:hypothetical protein
VAISKEQFWAARPILAFTKRLADAKMVSAYALLGWVFVERLTMINYKTTYRSYKPRASLNMILLISGPTGIGKSVAKHLVSEFYDFGINYSHSKPIQAGSGEAVSDAFFTRVLITDENGLDKWVEDWVNPNHCQIFHNDEIDFHKGKANQNSSTMDATYLSLYSGEQLGRKLANFKGREVPAGEYRGIVVFNAQPARDPFRSAGAVNSGLTSRILNLSARNPEMDKEFHPLTDLELGTFTVPPLYQERGDVFMYPDYIALPEMIAEHQKQDLQAHLLQRDSSYSHTLLTRAKISCVLAALEGRTSLVSEDWELAGHLIEHSIQVDAEIKKAIIQEERREAGLAGTNLGHRLHVADDVKHARQLGRVVKGIRTHSEALGIDLSEGLSTEHRKIIKQRIAHRDRPLFDDAVWEIENAVKSSTPISMEGGEKNEL